MSSASTGRQQSPREPASPPARPVAPGADPVALSVLEDSVLRSADDLSARPVGRRRRRERRDGLATRTTAVVGLITGIVGIVSGVLTSLFVVLPNLGSSTTNLAEIGNVAVEPSVTLGEYLTHPTIQRAFSRADLDAFRKKWGSHLATMGTVVHFDFQMSGYRNIELVPRWTLFAGEPAKRVGESEEIDPLSLQLMPKKKDADIGSWEFWVDGTVTSASPLFARIELYDAELGTRLIFKDTDAFQHP